MIGTMIRIWRVERELSKIQQDDFQKQGQQVIDLQSKLKLILPDSSQKQLSDKISGIHAWLHTKMMLAACVWAALATFFAFVSSALALITVLRN